MLFYSGHEFLFSTLASELISEYRSLYPSVLDALVKFKKSSANETDQNGRPKVGLTPSDLFPDSLDPMWSLDQVAKWCSEKPFGRMVLMGADSAAITPKGTIRHQWFLHPLPCRCENYRNYP